VHGGRVHGVETDGGFIPAAVVVSVQNIWANELQRWTGLTVPLVAERHRVLALAGPAPYTPRMPVFKDLASPGMLYARSYGGTQMLVSEGTAGERLDVPDTVQGDVPLEFVADLGAQVAARFPGWEEAGLASSWTGVYDVTPDWNPVLGAVPEVRGLVVGFGFSGHGFKLAPAVGRVLAQVALGQPTDVPLAPYALERFRAGRELRGRYGAGAVS
jgi:sarcosine oxidase subunit beta